MVLLRQAPSQFLSLLTIGVVCAVFLAIAHQVMWNHAWDGDTPRPGGNLEGRLSPGLESLIIRTFAFISNLVTVSMVAAVIAAVGSGIRGLVGSAGPKERRDVDGGREASASR